MKKDLWAYKDYKKYITDRLDDSKELSRSGLAAACQCQSAYVSQVLGGNANLSAEQIFKASVYLNLSNEEHDYFMLLAQMNKAGTAELKDYYKAKLLQLNQDRLNLSKRLNTKSVLSVTEQAQYFSSWMYVVVHLMTTIAEYKNEEDIAEVLALPVAKIRETMDFLIRTGLVIRKKEGFAAGGTYNHLSSDSHLLPMMHINGRQLAAETIQRMQQRDFSTNLIYTSTITLSRDDFNKIKEILIQAIQETKDIIRPSKEEILGVFNLDFIRLT
jgi:uncharacterized protein (TIGR02147 family)